MRAAITLGTTTTAAAGVSILSAAGALAKPTLAGKPIVAVCIARALAVSRSGNTLIFPVHNLASITRRTEVVGNAGLRAAVAVGVAGANTAATVCVGLAHFAKTRRCFDWLRSTNTLVALLTRATVGVYCASNIVTYILYRDTLVGATHDTTRGSQRTAAVRIACLKATVSYALALAEILPRRSAGRWLVAGFAEIGCLRRAAKSAFALLGIAAIARTAILVLLALAAILIDQRLQPGSVVIHAKRPARAVTKRLTTRGPTCHIRINRDNSPNPIKIIQAWTA